jgi:hypothetical protein
MKSRKISKHDRHLAKKPIEYRLEWEAKQLKQRRMCGSKKKYESNRQAQAAIKLRLGEPDGPDSLRAYKCKYCEGWHLTKSALISPA